MIKKIYRNIKQVLVRQNVKGDTIKFKKEVWQTEAGSTNFIKGTDADSVVAADIMNKEVNEFFLAHCSPKDKVLDIGCGHGIVSEFLAENGIHVSAVDISQKLLDDFSARIAGKNLPIEIKKGDAYNIPYANEQFDVVVARMFLPHFPDWPVVLKEMTRTAKKGALLLVHFSSAENTEIGKRIGIKDCIFASSPNIGDPWTFYAEADTNELTKICTGLGLQLVKRTPVSFFLHNRILGYQLGTEQYNKYMEEVQKHLKDEAVKNFVIWFDKHVIANCSPALSHFNIITFKKN
jgi:2-polyprenyl-3-methyl-5-hydroxy-6-metoxy-1,4-benzoquinol methylase